MKIALLSWTVGKIAWLFILLLLLCFLFVALWRRSINVQFDSGASVDVQPSCLAAWIRGAKCIVNVRSKSGKTARIDFLQDYFCSPVLILPSTNESVFYCIYDNDVDFQLLKIDISQGFTTTQPDDIMGRKILAATCNVERVSASSTNDWAAVNFYLRQMPMEKYKRSVIGADLILFHIYTSKDILFNSVQNFGDQGMYNGDVWNPSYTN